MSTKNTSNEKLADFLLQQNQFENVLSEVLKFFSMNCLDFCAVDPRRLDDLVERFNACEGDRKAILVELISLIRSAGEGSGSDGDGTAAGIVAFVEAHLYENLSIRQIAQELNISYYYMCHLFKDFTGTAISSFRNKKRMQKAARMLVETDCKVSEIALSCGYDNISYFTETFTRFTGISPSECRARRKDTVYLPFYDEDDIFLTNIMPSVRLLKNTVELPADGIVENSFVHLPTKEYKFLHEAAIIKFHETWFASWYCCPENELQGRTPICGRRSHDDGRTWTETEIIADDPGETVLYCPPVYAVCDDKLYLFLNEMVGPDLIHSLNLFLFDEEKDRFVRLWSRPIPFKLNTNAVKLPNGKLMLPGRIAKLDGFPTTPAVLLSDEGTADTQWRLVRIMPNGTLPDGETLVHPEISAFLAQGTIYMLCRNDRRRVPLLYLSRDNGESWEGPYAHDIPIVNSKIYSGTLADGRNYIVTNVTEFNRSRLVLYISEKDSADFVKSVVLRSGPEVGAENMFAWHYPVAYEDNGKLYVIYTVSIEKDGAHSRGAALSIVDLSRI